MTALPVESVPDFTMIDVALSHARAGRPVFPVRPNDKKPMVGEWGRVATTNEVQIRSWWGNWPRAMIGLPTGKGSGLWVVDMDVDEAKRLDGVSALSRLIALPETLTVTTPRGGRHAYFRFDPSRAEVRCSAGKIAPGVDVRGEGGYVVLWGSERHDGRPYKQEGDLQPADAPEALYALLEGTRGAREPVAASRPPTGLPRDAASQVERYAAAALEGELQTVREAREGTRNETLNKAAYGLAGYVAAGALDEAEARDALLAAASDAGLTAREARATIASGMRAGTAKPRDLSHVGAPSRVNGHAVTAVNDRTAGPVVAELVEDDAFIPTGFTGEVPPPRPWAYGDFLMEQAVTGVAAPPGVGKTTFSFQIALAFALDRQLGPWSPRPGGGGKVWLLNGEEPKDELDRRFIAACIEMGVEESEAVARFAYNSCLARPIRLGSQDDKGRFVRSPDVDTIKALVRQHGFKLIILDPLIEFHNVKENDLEAFGRVGAVCREIATDCNCAVLIFHHTPKTANADTAAGDMNALRGGSPLIGVARFVHTMFAMSSKDAEVFGVSAAERPSFVRWDGAKANMTPVVGGAIWWRKLGVSLDNAAGVRPADSIGILRRASLEPSTPTPEQQALERATIVANELAALGGEISRVCIANGHTSPETGVALTTLCDALDPMVTGMKATKARGIITGRMAEGFEVGRHCIRLTHHHRGLVHIQRIHLEAIDGAA